MKPIKVMLPLVFLFGLTGCASHHHHHSYVKVTSRSHHHTRMKAAGSERLQAKAPKGKAKGWDK